MPPEKLCPIPGCKSFPFDDDEQVSEHLEIGDHAFLPPKGERQTPPSDEDVVEVKKLLAQHEDHPFAESLRRYLNRLRAENRLTAHAVGAVTDVLRGLTPQSSQ